MIDDAERGLKNMLVTRAFGNIGMQDQMGRNDDDDDDANIGLYYNQFRSQDCILGMFRQNYES